MTLIYNYLQLAWLKISNLRTDAGAQLFLAAVVLTSIPLKFAYSSIATILLAVLCLLSFTRTNFKLTLSLALPILFYLLMTVSAAWSIDYGATLNGLRKDLVFLIIPFAFSCLPAYSSQQLQGVFRFYSFGFAAYASFFIGVALVTFLSTGDNSAFFYHNLVTIERNAIYMSVFASFALFYFISLPQKQTIEKVALAILAVFVLLLSSKSVIFIDAVLVVVFYSFFSKVPKSVRYLTLISLLLFLAFSLVFVKNIRERFLLEYETAFVDNTLNTTIGNGQGKVYNISLHQAWNMDKFEQNHFFPGTALRIYQTRIFGEMLQEDAIFFTGYGLEASQSKIVAKANEHGLYNGYAEFNFHNQYVQTFAELGVFGFLLLLAMLFLNMRNAIKRADFLHIVFALSIIVLFLTESFFCRQRGLIFFTVLYCLFNTALPASKTNIEEK